MHSLQQSNRSSSAAVALAACVCILLLSQLCRLPSVTAALVEHERVAEYEKRNHTWPPLNDDYIPNTDGWRKIMERRFEQVQRIEDRGDMYNG